MKYIAVLDTDEIEDFAFFEDGKEKYLHGIDANSVNGEWIYLPFKPLEQEPRWIPVSERLPEKDGEYLCTIYDMDDEYEYMDIAEIENGVWCYKPYILVKAWMPLPKPYEPQESEEE